MKGENSQRTVKSLKWGKKKEKDGESFRFLKMPLEILVLFPLLSVPKYLSYF